MTHWAESYIGRPYVPGHYDCGSLVREVLLKQFGIELPLPSNVKSVCKQVRQLDSLRDELAIKIDNPREGDLVLMRVGQRVSHCGILIIDHNVQYILHAVRSAGQVLCQRATDLGRTGCRIVSFYRPKCH